MLVWWKDEDPLRPSWLYVFSACFSKLVDGRDAGQIFAMSPISLEDRRTLATMFNKSPIWSYRQAVEERTTYQVSMQLPPSFPDSWITPFCLILVTGQRSPRPWPIINHLTQFYYSLTLPVPVALI